MWVITFLKKDKMMFIGQGEGGYPYITDDYIMNHFASAEALCDYLDLMDKFDMWRYINIQKKDVHVAKITFNFDKHRVKKENGKWTLEKF